jgi:DNA-binding transcriptional regulator LsrR (DeoR family)
VAGICEVIIVSSKEQVEAITREAEKPGVVLVPTMRNSLEIDPEQAAMARVAWYYYVEGMTQNEIAERLGMNRIRVNRILAQARECGVVQVRIDSPVHLAEEQAIEREFGIRKAILVPTPLNHDQLTQSIANAAGAYISDRLKSGMSIGVGWGRTLRFSVNSIERKYLDNISVVSLLGGLTRGSVMNTYETASRMADIFKADCFYIAAPALADTETTASLFRSQSSVTDAFDHARRVDIAMISVGSLDVNSTMSKLGLIGQSDIDSLREAGAVGDLCAQWIDVDGNVIDHPVNRRVIALPVADLDHIPLVVLASGGKEKVPVIYGALKRNAIDVLVTDEETGAALLALKKSKED